MTRFEEIPRVHIIRKEDKNEISGCGLTGSTLR